MEINRDVLKKIMNSLFELGLQDEVLRLSELHSLLKRMIKKSINNNI